MTCGGVTEGIPIHVTATAQHRRPGDNIFAYRFMNKTHWRYNRNIAVSDLLCIEQCQNPTEVINMTMGKNHAGDIDWAKMLLGKVHGNAAGFQCGQGIHNNPTVVTFDQGHIGEIKTTQLIKALFNFKESANAVEFCLAPEAWINGVWGITFYKIIGCSIPDFGAAEVF